jgi:hypothetical protein
MTQDIKVCLPVKILDKQWAEKLLNGSVFMRSLFEFGVWNTDAKVKVKEMDNSFRRDIGEGLIRNINPKIGDSFFDSIFSSKEKAIIQNFWYIDESLKFIKIYCMYCLTYNTNKKEFERPDERIKDFGDTAVIFRNGKEFTNRVVQKLFDKFEDNVHFDMKQVLYYDISKDFGDFGIFWKGKGYEWQNELRMAVALLDCRDIKTDENGNRFGILLESIDPIKLEIGSIRDIAVAIPTEDLVKLKLPAGMVLPDYQDIMKQKI